MAEGGYTRDKKKLLYVAVTTSQMISLKNKILRIDPKAFITIIDVSEVKGKGICYSEIVNVIYIKIIDYFFHKRLKSKFFTINNIIFLGFNFLSNTLNTSVFFLFRISYFLLYLL